MWQMVFPVSEGNTRLKIQRDTSEDHRLLWSDIRAAEVAAMAMKASSGAPAPREEGAGYTAGALNSDYTSTCWLSSALILLTETFGDCLIRAHYKHQVTFARS